jgi:hypothetical protein
VSTLIAAPLGVGLWGFSEVQDGAWEMVFEQAAEQATRAAFLRLLGTIGGADRLLIVYNAACLELVRLFAIYDINPPGLGTCLACRALPAQGHRIGISLPRDGR